MLGGRGATKFLAKLASEAAKPRAGLRRRAARAGVVAVPASDELGFLHALPVQALWGVGPETLERLRGSASRPSATSRSSRSDALVTALGDANGQHLHPLANGIDDRPVDPQRPLSRSVTRRRSPPTTTPTRPSIPSWCACADAVAARLRAAGRRARTVTLKVRFHDFRTITRSSTLPHPIDTGPAVTQAASALLHDVDVSAGVRLLGVSASGLIVGDTEQLSLAVDDEPEVPWGPATVAIDAIRRRFGRRPSPRRASRAPAGVRVARRGAQQWGPDHDSDRPGPE